MQTKCAPMNINTTPVLTSNSLENQVKRVVTDECKNEKPSRKAINAILSFAASYECLDTKIGTVDVILN